jgi:hypothetical protein
MYVEHPMRRYAIGELTVRIRASCALLAVSCVNYALRIGYRARARPNWVLQHEESIGRNVALAAGGFFDRLYSSRIARIAALIGCA